MKTTYNILMKTSEEISKHVKPICSLKMAGKAIRVLVICYFLPLDGSVKRYDGKLSYK